MSKKSHHFLTLWPWPLTYDLEKLIRSGHYHYQCVYHIWEQSILWFLSYRVNTIAGGGRLWRKTITSPNPSDTGDIITNKKINDGTHSQCSRTYKDHGPWVLGTHKEVNDFESLYRSIPPYNVTMPQWFICIYRVNCYFLILMYLQCDSFMVEYIHISWLTNGSCLL